MAKIDFVSFEHVRPEDFLPIVNEQELRAHLIDHETFTPITIREWIGEKLKIESLEGCRIRAIYIDKMLAGWCGIQPDDNGFELAIVISKKFWGAGPTVFKTLILWTKELGHKEVIFHLLDTRPQYKALRKIATKTHKTRLMGRCFTTYYIAIDK